MFQIDFTVQCPPPNQVFKLKLGDQSKNANNCVVISWGSEVTDLNISFTSQGSPGSHLWMVWWHFHSVKGLAFSRVVSRKFKPCACKVSQDVTEMFRSFFSEGAGHTECLFACFSKVICFVVSGLSFPSET